MVGVAQAAIRAFCSAVATVFEAVVTAVSKAALSSSIRGAAGWGVFSLCLLPPHSNLSERYS